MKITEELFEAYLKCPTKSWLRALSEPASGNIYAKWVQARSESYRLDAAKELIINELEIKRGIALDATNIKTDQWRFALDLPASVEIVRSREIELQIASPEAGQSPQTSTIQVKTRIHAIERIPSAGRGQSKQFIPIRFIFRNKLTKEDKLEMAFDAFVLAEMLGRKINLGKIIHGDSHTTLKVKTSALHGEVRKHLQKITALLESPTPPDLVLNRHCGECEFQERCRKIALEKDDLSLLSSMSAKERGKFRSKGIFTVTQLSYTFRPRRRRKRLGDKRERYHHSLKALAIREKKIHIVGSPELKIEGTPVYLDVEGLPDRDFYYLIGLRIGSGDSAIQHSLWADTVLDEGKIWHEFLAILKTVEQPILIHYGSYETNFLKVMKDRHGGLQVESWVSKTIGCAINLNSVMFARIYFPTLSNGLKEIARHLNFEWSDVEASGMASIAWREEWEKYHSVIIKQRLVVYNADDCTALAQLSGRISEFMANSDKSSCSSGVVTADSLPRNFPCTFKANKILFAELEQINRAAYWDYQRERVLVKSSERLKKNVRKIRTKKKLKPHANKTVECPGPTTCPKCREVKIYKHQSSCKTVVDVRFGIASIKRWVTKYLFHRYRCPTCRAVFHNPEYAWSAEKYGPNLRSFCVYQNIELRVPQERIAAFLNKILGFNLSRGKVNKFKGSAACYYESTYEALLESIAAGTLVHADETKVNIRGQDGYIWVFTNLEQAVYLYSPSREGELVQHVLKDFNGVLVSDFYSAYDSIKCAQQKCLIHLIRDLNDELFKESFNIEFKELVGEVAALLKPMIETIDRFGLKMRYLCKHKTEAERFFRWLSRRDYQSNSALKCKQRLEKNRQTLFTFLEHDDVPWNNNNAEHAVKAFALLRRDFDGVTTEKGVKEYLILLSVCQSCKCMGVDFLDFLRSGEKDIHAFAESRRRGGMKGGKLAFRELPYNEA